MNLLYHTFIRCLLFGCLLSVSYAERIQIPGITEPLRDADISAPIAGKIKSIRLREGQKVDQGKTVVELHHELETLEVNRRRVLFESKAELEAANAKVETLKVDLDSTRALFDTTQSVSQEELDKKHLEYKLATAEKLKEESEEAREEIELKMAEHQLEQRMITAPFTGTIADVYLEEGEDCNPGEPIFRLVDLSQCYFICNVEANLTTYLQTNQIVELEIIAGFSPLKKTGNIELIAPTIDPASGLRKIKVLIDNQDQQLTPGATGILIIDTAIR